MRPRNSSSRFASFLVTLAPILAAVLCGEDGLAAPDGTAPFGPARVLSSTRGMVVSAAPEASSAGAEILAAGGNAMDAAIATALALAVVYPQAGNLAGGGFLVARSPDGTVQALDFRETAPARSRPATCSWVPTAVPCRRRPPRRRSPSRLRVPFGATPKRTAASVVCRGPGSWLRPSASRGRGSSFRPGSPRTSPSRVSCSPGGRRRVGSSFLAGSPLRPGRSCASPTSPRRSRASRRRDRRRFTGATWPHASSRS